MARFLFACALVAFCAASALATKDPPKGATYVEVTMSIDNAPDAVKKQQAVIEKELAKNICKQGKPTFLSIKDASGLTQGAHQTTLVYRCTGKDLKEIYDD